MRFRLFVSREFGKVRDEEDRVKREEMLIGIVKDFDVFIKMQDTCLNCERVEVGKGFSDLLCSQCREDYGHSLIGEL